MSGPVLLDALRFPFAGAALIEASAGTGKTFTIAALYLRLVLAHLRRLGLPVRDEQIAGRYRRWSGDAVEMNKGEILLLDQ